MPQNLAGRFCPERFIHKRIGQFTNVTTSHGVFLPLSSGSPFTRSTSDDHFGGGDFHPQLGPAAVKA
jgi:hypothetical protein